MDGIFLLDKPAGLTSQQVVKEVKKKLKAKKVGHAGTLDPLATGLLVILVNKATKLSNKILNQDKSYWVEAKLFSENDTGDITGKVIKDQKPFNINLEQVNHALNQFNDFSYWQKPPIYSAIKIKGKKLYEYARKGIEVEIPLKLVRIKKMKLLDYSAKDGKINFFVECSKGTYIRSLVQDLAEKLGTIATVSQLRRISSGNFHIKQAVTLEELNETNIFII